VSYPNDNLSDDIDALVSGASSLGVAASSVGTISNGSDVVVENFAGLQSALSGLSAFLSELKSGHFYTPVGALMPFAGTSAFVPSGWLVCDGRSFVAAGVSTDLQSVLSAASFSDLPDLRGRVIAGVDSTGLTDINANFTRLRPLSASAANVGSVIGDARPQLHTHTQNSHSHTSSIRNEIGWAGIGSSSIAGSAAGPNWTLGGGGGVDATTATNQNQFSGTQQNVQPTIMLNYIIKN
jgi:microcystin-dependent protein